MALDVGTLASQMLAAALPMLKKDAEDAESFAKTEFTKIAQTIVSIGEQLADGQINKEQADLLLDMQKSASRTVLLTLQGLALLAVEAAINAALNVVKGAVNIALGFDLIA
jgi:subtilase family serine protease